MIVEIEQEETETVENTEKTSQAKTVTYPSTVGVDADQRHVNYLVFNAVKPMTDTMDMRSGALRQRRQNFLRSAKSRNKNLKEKTLAYIQLYMPSLNEQYAHSYEKSETSFLADVANQITKFASGKKDVGSGEDLKAAGGAVLDSALSALKSVGANAARQTMAQTTGRIYGEKSTGVYQETNLRTQSFSFVLNPKDLKELKEVGKIIHYFRKYSSAKLLSDKGEKGDDSYNTLEVPPIWYVEERIRDKELPRYIPKFFFGPSVITSVNVNKTPEEVYKYFKNTGGDPVNIELQIEMQELIPVTQNYWDEADEGII